MFLYLGATAGYDPKSTGSTGVALGVSLGVSDDVSEGEVFRRRVDAGVGCVVPARCEEQDEGGSEGWSDRTGGSHALESLTRA